MDQMTLGRVLINVVTGGFPHDRERDGDFTKRDERYARPQEFIRVVKRAWTEASLDEPRRDVSHRIEKGKHLLPRTSVRNFRTALGPSKQRPRRRNKQVRLEECDRKREKGRLNLMSIHANRSLTRGGAEGWLWA